VVISPGPATPSHRQEQTAYQPGSTHTVDYGFNVRPQKSDTKQQKKDYQNMQKQMTTDVNHGVQDHQSSQIKQEVQKQVSQHIDYGLNVQAQRSDTKQQNKAGHHMQKQMTTNVNHGVQDHQSSQIKQEVQKQVSQHPQVRTVVVSPGPTTAVLSAKPNNSGSSTHNVDYGFSIQPGKSDTKQQKKPSQTTQNKNSTKGSGLQSHKSGTIYGIQNQTSDKELSSTGYKSHQELSSTGYKSRQELLSTGYKSGQELSSTGYKSRQELPSTSYKSYQELNASGHQMQKDLLSTHPVANTLKRDASGTFQQPGRSSSGYQAQPYGSQSSVMVYQLVVFYTMFQNGSIGLKK